MKKTSVFLALAIAIVAASLPDPQPRFTDITQAAGLQFKHNSGREGKKYLLETLGAGGAFLDFDNDGWPDILLVNSKNWTPRGRRSLHALYHNNHNGIF